MLSVGGSERWPSPTLTASQCVDFPTYTHLTSEQLMCLEGIALELMPRAAGQNGGRQRQYRFPGSLALPESDGDLSAPYAGLSRQSRALLQSAIYLCLASICLRSASAFAMFTHDGSQGAPKDVCRRTSVKSPICNGGAEGIPINTDEVRHPRASADGSASAAQKETDQVRRSALPGNQPRRPHHAS